MFPQLFPKKVCEKGRKGIYPQGRGARSLRVFSFERFTGGEGGGGYRGAFQGTEPKKVTV